jgi:hypothetical protein
LRSSRRDSQGCRGAPWRSAQRITAHRAGDQQAANVALAHFRGLPERLLAAGRGLSRQKPKPARKVATPFELLHWRPKGLDGQGADRTHTRHRLQAAECLSLAGASIFFFISLIRVVRCVIWSSSSRQILGRAAAESELVSSTTCSRRGA